MNIAKDLISLKEDKHYYGDVGKQYMSNSDIYRLLREPKKFLDPTETTLPLLQGGYLHTSILEPHKLPDIQVIDASTRNTKIYKEAEEENGGVKILLQREADELDILSDAFLANEDFSELLLEDSNKFEVPGIKEIQGRMWKGKCDVIGDELIIDIKTCQNIDKFHYSARDYNYDSQAYIYNQIFGKPIIFLAIEKGSCRMNKFTCSSQFYIDGKNKVERALKIYDKYFGPNATSDISQYYETKEL